MSPVDPRDHATHDLDALSEALDGRLSKEPLEAVLDLVRSCPDCRAAYEALAWTRAQAGRLPAVAFPPGLEEEIRRGLNQEASRPGLGSIRRIVGLALAAALLVSLAGILVRLASRPPPLPETVAEDFRARATERRPLALETADPARLEAWLASASLGFPTRVFDLRMMGYELRGGGTDTVAGRRSAVIVYRDVTTGREVICRMLVGGLGDLPSPDGKREHDGIPFRVYQVEGITLVFWPEGNVLCMLVGDGDPEALVQLAFAKAMKARARDTWGARPAVTVGFRSQ
jgi:anti-sigma factor RsiW